MNGWLDAVETFGSYKRVVSLKILHLVNFKIYLAKSKRGLPISNQSPVFHGTRVEVRDGDHVLLWKRVFYIEILFIIFQYLHDCQKIHIIFLNSIIYGRHL